MLRDGRSEIKLLPAEIFVADVACAYQFNSKIGGSELFLPLLENIEPDWQVLFVRNRIGYMRPVSLVSISAASRQQWQRAFEAMGVEVVQLSDKPARQAVCS